MQKVRELNKKQKESAEHFKGPMLVVAGPGSGKTTVIISRIINLGEKLEVDPKSILAVTFSRAAANEMKKRLRDASRGRINISFGTFHSVFFRLLRENGICGRQNVMSGEEEWAFMLRLLRELELEASDEDEFISDFLNEYSLMRSSMIPLSRFQPDKIEKPLFTRIVRRYEKIKELNGKIDFGDMETQALALLSNDSRVLEGFRQKNKYILIDEFQDISAIQYEITKLAAHPLNNVFAVGDEDQSIYMFRGSSPEFMLSFEKDFPGARRVALEYNYRSADSVIRLSESIIAENKIRFGKSIVGTGKKGPRPTFFTAGDSGEEALMIVKAVKSLHESGAALDGIAVAYRKNIQGAPFVRAFKDAGINFRIRDGMKDIYSHFVSKDIMSYMRLALDGSDNAAFLSIINKPRRYISKDITERLKSLNGAYMDIINTLPHVSGWQAEHIDTLRTDLVRIRNRKPYEAVKYIRNVCGYNDYIKEYARFARRDESLFMLIADELLETAKGQENFAGFFSYIDELKKSADEKHEDEDAVTLTTLHGAKGLEFDTVFLPGLNEGVLPHEKSVSERETEEERRLFYVGATRARKRVFISWVKFGRGGREAAASRFISGLDGEYELGALLDGK